MTRRARATLCGASIVFVVALGVEAGAARSADAPLTGIRPFRALAPSGLLDISRDGRLVSFVRYRTSSRYEVGVVDLRAARIRPLATGLGSVVAPLSPDGRHLVVRRWRRLFVVDTATGAERYLASAATFGRVAWLDDGRVVFREGAGRLVSVWPGGRPRSFGVRLPARASWSASPDGRYVLYATRPRVVLVDRVTGRHRRLRVGPFVERVAGEWSPDSRHFLVGDGEYLGYVAVYDVRGRVEGRFRSWGATWSTDGRYVLTYGGLNGSSVTYLQSLRMFSLRRRATVTLFTGGAAGAALAGPGGWILYSRYDWPLPTGTKLWGADVPARLYLGRLNRRWRS